MALIARSGSLEQPSAQGVPVSEAPWVDPRNKYAANAENYDKLAHIEDTFTTQSSVNPVRYPETYKMLLAYPKGFLMVVPYYHRNTPNQDIRSFMARFSFEDEDIIHEDFTKIMNLEMRLTDSIQFQQLEEDKSVSLTGTAVTYPGLEPYEGDLFILEVDNKQQVVMIVNKVDPTTFRQERYYQVQFTAYMQLSKILYERIEMMVRDTCYFERKKYFGESELTFLSEKSWFILKELEAYRRKISQDIISFFYNKDRESFFRVDGVYDPYLTEFLRHKLTVRDNRVHPLQLLVPLQNFEYSIWFKLLDAENCESLADVWKYAIPRYKDPRYFTSDFNALVGKYYLELV
jgi:hypothetical protein